MKLPEWAREYGITPSALYFRIYRNGWPIEKALKTSVWHPKKYEYNGKMYTTGQLAAIHGGLGQTGIDVRIKRGMSIEEIMRTPNMRPKKNLDKEANKPERCTHPDCGRCPYSDCRW